MKMKRMMSVFLVSTLSACMIWYYTALLNPFLGQGENTPQMMLSVPIERTLQLLDDSKTLVVVVCNKPTQWLEYVPPNYRLVVYQKCGKSVGNNISKLFSDFEEINHLPNFASEECSSYLHYMLTYYRNLTDITLFLHDDSLMGMRGDKDHTQFRTFPELDDAINRLFLASNKGKRSYMSLGSEYLTEYAEYPSHGQAMKSMWPFFVDRDTNEESAEKSTFPLEIGFQPGAQIAVRKERILARPKDVYEGLNRHILYGYTIPNHLGGARAHCCALERTWHILLGEPAILPSDSISSDLLNKTKCNNPQC